MLIKQLCFPIIFVLLFFYSCKNIHNIPAKSANRVWADSLITMTENGILHAINAQSVKAPNYWQVEYRVVFLVPEGRFVHVGDTLVRFDPAPVLEKLDAAKAELALARQKLAQLKEENALHLRDQLTNIRALRMQYAIDSARLADALYESEATRQDLALQLKKSALDLKKAEQKFAVQKIINRTNYHLQQIEVEHALGEVKRISTMLKAMVLVATQPGIAVYANMRGRSSKVREGETFYPGQRVMQIADLSKMMAVLMINEVDREAIKTGQRVRLMVNAYPDTTFTGRVFKISRIADLIRDDGTVKAYETEVVLDGGGNYRLRPGLSVRATIITDTLHGVFKVPEWCLHQDKKGWFVVEESGKSVSVDPVRFNDGFAFVKGELRDRLSLKER